MNDRMQENMERIVLCNALACHKTQLAFVLTTSIVQQIQDLASKLRQPDHQISSLLCALVFLQDTQYIQTNELYGKLRELLKEYNQQMLQHNAATQRQQQHLLQGGNQSNSASNILAADEKMPVYYTQLNDYFIQVRQISMQLKQRLKQCNLYNHSQQANYPCIPPNSVLDLV